MYDVINILEALRMTSRKEKNKYVWHGTGGLPAVLQHLQNQAMQDGSNVLPGSPDEPPQPHSMHCRVQTAPGMHIEVFAEESADAPYSSNSTLGTKRGRQGTTAGDCPGPKRRAVGESGSSKQDEDPAAVEVDCITEADQDLMPPDKLRQSANICSQACVAASVARATLSWKNDVLSFRDSRAESDAASSAKRDKSLGTLAQRFVQLFLVGRSVLALEHAAKILMAASGLDASSVDPTEAAFKTRVRRLYDVANVLQSLRLVTKVTFAETSCARKPAFAWRGLGAVPLLPGRAALAVRAEIQDVAAGRASSDGSGVWRSNTATSAKLARRVGPTAPRCATSGGASKSASRQHTSSDSIVSMPPKDSARAQALSHEAVPLPATTAGDARLLGGGHGCSSDTQGSTVVQPAQGFGSLSLEQKFEMGRRIANEEAHTCMSPAPVGSPSSRSTSRRAAKGKLSYEGIDATPQQLQAIGSSPYGMPGSAVPASALGHRLFGGRWQPPGFRMSH